VETVQVSIETGDIEYASYAAINYCSNLVLVGEPLESVKQKYKNCIQLIKSIQQGIFSKLCHNMGAISIKFNRGFCRIQQANWRNVQ
jgi:hypothetical protein